MSKNEIQPDDALLREISSGESDHLEFKFSVPADNVKYVKTAIAFANTKGGKIIFGIDDKSHEIKGISSDELFEDMDRIVTAISDSCQPQVIHYIEPHTIAGKNLIIVSVPPGPNRPYFLKAKGMNEGTYVRVGGTSRPATIERIRDLLREGSKICWDELPCSGYKIKAESAEQLCAVIKQKRAENNLPEREVSVQQLINWKLLTEHQDGFVPSNAFVLLTDPDFFPYARTQCAMFKGKDRVFFIDKREYDGPIYQQINDALGFVERNIRLAVEIGDGAYRREKYELPLAAVREMIVNAICHRDYQEASCVQVAIFDDRLEVASPGGLYKDLTFAQLMRGRSVARNRAVSNVFAQMGLIEAWGTGIHRIIEEAKSFGLKQPLIEVSDNEFRITLYRDQNFMRHEDVTTNNKLNREINAHAETKTGTLKAVTKNLNNRSDNAAGSDQDKSAIRTGSDEIRKVASNADVEVQILNLIKKSPDITQKEMASVLHAGIMTIKRYTAKLQLKGMLTRGGSRKNGYWIISG
ncbi:MAG: ATP-binding protein [Succinivibrio sp.]|jgi:predicted HTH transcriptional regulator|nr:ATP-binding protein [Succinivibrio sp.]